MTATKVIDRLTELRTLHGDLEVLMDVGDTDLIPIGEIDLDADDNGFILWKRVE